jgi:hypothetical protein
MPATAKVNLSTPQGVRDIDPLIAETTWDERLKGFGLRTRRSADPKKWRWVLVYRESGRGSAQVKLSEPFSSMTPDAARKWAEREKGRKGTDLGQRAIEIKKRQVRAEERLTPSMQRLWDEYWEAEGRLKKASHSYEQLWRDHLSPTFAALKVRDIDPQAVTRFKVSKAKTPGACNRSLALLSRLLSLAVQWGYRKGCAPEHPVKGVTRYPETASEFYFSEAELLRILAAAEADSDADQNEKARLKGQATNRAGGLIIRLLALTGARLSEATRAHWGQFEFRDEAEGADSDDAGRLFRSDPGHHSDMMPVSLSLIADF